jgi:hypothetical protein
MSRFVIDSAVVGAGMACKAGRASVNAAAVATPEVASWLR